MDRTRILQLGALNTLDTIIVIYLLSIILLHINSNLLLENKNFNYYYQKYY